MSDELAARHGPRIVAGDARNLPFLDDSMDLIITSPPYWGLRDYGVDNQIGIEDRHLDYLDQMTEVLSEMWRVLRLGGTCWLNVGDTYNTRAIIRESAHNGGLGHERDSLSMSWAEARDKGLTRYSARQGAYLKDKDLMLLPAKLAQRAIEVGWWLRSDCIWSKPHTTPERVADRPQRTHEYLYMLTKGKRTNTFHRQEQPRGSVWEIAPYRGGRFQGPAVMPPALAELLIRLSSNAGDRVLDPFSGSGVVPTIAAELGREGYGLDLRPT